MNTIEDEDAGRPLGAQYSMDHLETFYLERPYASAYPDPEMDAAVSEHQKYALPTTTGYVDPFIAVKEMMWMLPGINEIVIDILNRMEKAFAYNSVYFLKVILDLQALYLPMRPPPESETMLDATLVLRIARVLSGRLARKNNDRASLSRELQLRTLISALSLLYQLSVGKLNSDSFAKLLRDVTEREADLEASRASDKGFGAGENEFLTRYACDLIRCLPSDLSGYRGCNREAIHFLFAAGFINQLEDEPSKQTIEAVFARVTAAPSLWHRDMHHLYEGAVGAISLYHQSKSEPPPKGSQYASTLAVEVARSILDNLELQLQALDEPSLPAGTPENQIDWDLNVDMYICGMLDLLSQLISAFPDSEDIARESKTLAIRLIRDSDKRAFRYKAFEIVICAALGVGENEYYDAMRKLELVMETEMSVGRARQLQEEKREAMDRCEEKNVLSTGAAESMQHRLLNSLVGSRVVATPLDQIMPQSTRAFHGDGRLHIRRSASPASPVPTLSSVGKSWETASRSEHNPTQPSSPCCRADADELTLASPADDCACVSQTDAWQPSVFTSNRSPSEARRGSYPESLIIPLYSLIGARELPDAVDFGPETNLCPHRELSTLFSARLSIFDEPEPYEDDFPIRQQPSPTTRIAGAKRNSTLPLRDTPFPAMNNASNETLDSFVSAASHTLLYSSTASMYAEPSLSRTSSAQAGQPKMVTIQRQSRVPRGRRAWSLQLDKPLPPVIDSEHSRSNYLAENAPEPVYIMQRAEPEGRYSYTGPREEKHRSMSTHGFRSFQSTSFTPLPPIEDNGAEHIPLPKTAVVDYMSAPTETEYKFNSKDSCIKTFVSTDTRHAVFLSPNSFQVFSIPVQGQKFQPKPKCVYRLGDWEGSRWEGLKRGKSHRQYRSAAVSVRYLVTITKERLQVHDLADDQLKVIYQEVIKGWEYCSVDIAADKLVVGLSTALKGENISTFRIYRMNAHTYDGHRFDRCGHNDIHLPLHHWEPRDTPSILTLSKDGNFLTCATPQFGYYFVWDISRSEPKLLARHQLKKHQGPDAEILTGVTLFPDTRHLLCSTFPATPHKNENGGCYTESMYPGHSGEPSQRMIRQISQRVSHSTISPGGNCCAFLSKNGTVWIVPVTHFSDEDNLTSLPQQRSRARLNPQNFGDHSGRVQFSPGGDRLVAVDKKGKLVIMEFPLEKHWFGRPEGVPAQEAPLAAEMAGWAVKTQVGGYF